MIAALFVAARGCYAGLDGVDCWPESSGWACHVEQGRYGHAAKKATWLYAYGVELPQLRWGSESDTKSKALVSWCGNHVSSGEARPRLGKRAASATPPEFRDVLIRMARSAGVRSTETS